MDGTSEAGAPSDAQPGEPSCPGIAILREQAGRGSTNPVFLVSAGSRGTARHDGGAGVGRAAKNRAGGAVGEIHVTNC